MNKPNVFILLLAALSLTFMQCEKGDSEEKSNNPYTGQWELLSITGGFTGDGYPPDFSILYIGGDATYWLGESSTDKLAEGSYEVFKKGEDDWIRFDAKNNNSQHHFDAQEKMIGFSIEGTLVLSEPCCDLYQYEFKKLKDDDR